MASKKKPRRRAGRGLPLALLLFLLGFLPAAFIYYALFVPRELPSAGYRLSVPRGQTAYQLGNRLAADGIVPSSLLTRLWLRMHPELTRPRPGVYLVQGRFSTAQLLSRLGHLEPVNRLRVVEGTTFKNLMQQLDARDDLVHELTGKSDAEVLEAIGVNRTYPEGLFAPDTYDIAPGDTDTFTLKRLYQQQQTVLQRAWEQRADNLPYRNPYEALIMASIIEKETGAAAERARIAGVFVRRMRMGMRLQTDPTVIYGLGAGYDGHLTHADLQHPTPYNTYVIDGLPPTPIALPGQAAINAALHPADGDALYFVAKGDGTHQFSATLKDQDAAIRAFQLHRATGYHSWPAREAQ